MRVKVKGKFEGEAIVKEGRIKILLQPPFKLKDVEIINHEAPPSQSKQQKLFGQR